MCTSNDRSRAAVQGGPPEGGSRPGRRLETGVTAGDGPLHTGRTTRRTTRERWGDSRRSETASHAPDGDRRGARARRGLVAEQLLLPRPVAPAGSGRDGPDSRRATAAAPTAGCRPPARRSRLSHRAPGPTFCQQSIASDEETRPAPDGSNGGAQTVPPWVNSKTPRGMDLAGTVRPCTIRRTHSVVSRLNACSPHRTQTRAGIPSTST